jgi:hypothetical protein
MRRSWFAGAKQEHGGYSAEIDLSDACFVRTLEREMQRLPGRRPARLMNRIGRAISAG